MEAHGQAAPSASVCAADLLRRPGLSYDDLAGVDPGYVPLPLPVREQVDIALRYEGYIDKECRQVEAFRKAEDQLLPQGFDYHTLSGLRIEARQKLSAHQPRSLGEPGGFPASRRGISRCLWCGWPGESRLPAPEPACRP